MEGLWNNPPSKFLVTHARVGLWRRGCDQTRMPSEGLWTLKWGRGWRKRSGEDTQVWGLSPLKDRGGLSSEVAKKRPQQGCEIVQGGERFRFLPGG